MNVKELKEAIANLPDDMEVILQKDSEGNGYSPLAGADPNTVYVPRNTWSGEIYSTNYEASEHCLEEEEWEKLKAGPHALVLFPVN